jgi:hypothetical protein
MGMFDSVIIKYKLPLPNEPYGYTGTNHFQTKDFENALDCYELREDGTLWLRECEREYIGGNPNGKTFREKFGTCKETKVWWTQVHITKTIKVYSYEQTDGSYDYSIDYKITIIDGIIKSAELEKFEAIPNEIRKLNNKMWLERVKARKQFENTIRYKLIYGPYNKILKYIFLKMHKINNFFSVNIWKIEDKFKI